ncbi:Fc receptor-like protein 5 isoform 1-T1 [Anomaloglossus baeobatrachus]|uniref:Fc receptor-like protein 5 isoform X1 n=1 Tax=Anomaloglossus baeobatrachus TaxID=238106 RepID=UPI003F4FD949
MCRLCVLCVLLSSIQGLDPGANNHTDVYARPGSDVLLPITYNLTRNESSKQCDEFTWRWKNEASTIFTPIIKNKRCKNTYYNFTNYNVTVSGSLTISNVTKKNSGEYKLEVRDSNGKQKITHKYTLHIQVPVSEPLLNVSCLLDGRADIICGIDSGDDPLFSIFVNGRSLLENCSSSRTVGEASEGNVSTTSPGPWNITCSVRNGVSDSETRKSEVKCAVPVSDPVLKVRCLRDGILEMFCSVENGSDPLFSLSVNGTSLVVNDKKEINVTTSSPGPWDVQCSVGNSLLWKKTNVMSPACTVPPSDPILEFICQNGSLGIICSVEKGSDLIFSLSVNGISKLKNITSDQRRINFTSSLSGPWDVHCSVTNSLDERNTSRTHPTCPVPISGPVINASCQINGAAIVVCEVEKGSNATFTWTLNGELIHWNSSVPSLVINASDFTSGAINISCSAENSISRGQSNETKISCDVPVSDPVLNASCLSNGSTLITCRLFSGTNPEFQLTVNEQVIPLPNISSSSRGFEHVISPRGAWNVSCSARNKLGSSMSDISNHSCPGFLPWSPHVFTHGAVCVLFSLLLLGFLTDLWRMKKRS